MKLHPRHDQVTRASIHINQEVTRAVATWDLTFAELVSILTACIASWTKFQIRDERKPPEWPT